MFASPKGKSKTKTIDLTAAPKKKKTDIIDLTLDDDRETSSRPAGAEPPRKRQRTYYGPDFSVGPNGGDSEKFMQCLNAQVRPYITEALLNVPHDTFKIADIARRVLGEVYHSAIEGDVIDINQGFLSQNAVKELAALARYRIADLCDNFPEYRKKPLSFDGIPVPLHPDGYRGSRLASEQGPLTAPARPVPRPAPRPAKQPRPKPPSERRREPQPAPEVEHRPQPEQEPDPEAQPPATEPPIVAVSSTNYRTRAQARSFKSWKAHDSQAKAAATPGHKAKVAWMTMPRRPYTTTEERETILRGTSKLVRNLPAAAALGSLPFHVDFTPDELDDVRRIVRAMCDKKVKHKRRDNTDRELGKMLRKRPDLLTTIPPMIELKGTLAQRDHIAIRNFLDELANRHKRPARHPKVLTLEVDESDKQGEAQRTSQISALLLAREVDGNRGFGRMRRHVNFTNEFRKAHEDDMEMRAEWVGCAGDIMTIAWTSDTNFICGATAHSDSHNQQYNKAGNLLLCSTTLGQLRAYPDHRIPRPIVEKGENSTEAMRESQSPWLYSSVVSSDYDRINNRAYTSSFDKTVKVWKVDDRGANMEALGTWEHAGNVNFVAVSKHESGMVATAADVPTQAVRVYRVDNDNVSRSPYQVYTGSRTWDEGNEETTATQKWAYFPATMQWGLAEGVQHLLLVGYSPRSLTGDDNDIPDEKLNTGEICLWNCLTGEKIKVLTASTQNVFEVVWHPTLPSFIVATSPAGLMVDDETLTQIRIFRPSLTPEGDTAFGEMQCLDCPAKDINELTIKPNSVLCSYVTAACTDGKVYVWDTSRGDKPIHALRHKKPIDEFDPNLGKREDLDVGVKFTAWGTTADRFYTGGSDGVLKVWNVRNLRQPLVRDLLEAPGAIACGAFSPCYSRLAIGDASGRVMLLSLNKEDEPPAKFVLPPMPAGMRPRRPVRRPIPVIEHPDPPAPHHNNQDQEPRTGVERGRRMLSSGQLIRHPDATVGVIQGPAYSTLGLHCPKSHFEGDASQPLLAKVEEIQQENQKMFRRRSLRVTRLRPLTDVGSVALERRHARNVSRDLDLRELCEMTKLDLLMDQVNIDDPIYDEGWDYEYEEGDLDKSIWAAFSE
ncbi:WD repeat domain-containing protein [Colletotrichum scovillei]|uniref:WD repeat domain-containing protein n=1 Tax=Colletotrichum scovillei TaxID=1209932 RepID=A0A9P7UGH9_9PEZI|nr:WD repeat domain-containing protein [Colletotrichum scovillei]KAF4777085.1 WD repeat domain-containing protein [Colletotrichum scovillei]KAG7047815.1 WD repeat domain-containing protein [Colletotrichum scovillei]KAG7060131.1 WD repeat domain-containing protein [Colletotrichum scovillei]KAG7067582.1 WD repeat domain-containing protein [Colletotrichum scovillei]